MSIKRFNGVNINEPYTEYESFSNECVDDLASVAEDVGALSSICYKNKLAYDRVYKKFKKSHPKETAKYDKSFEELRANIADRSLKTKRKIKVISANSDLGALVEILNSASNYVLELTDNIITDMLSLGGSTKGKKDVNSFMTNYLNAVKHFNTARNWMNTLTATIGNAYELKNTVKNTKVTKKLERPTKSKSKSFSLMSR